MVIYNLVELTKRFFQSYRFLFGPPLKVFNRLHQFERLDKQPFRLTVVVSPRGTHTEQQRDDGECGNDPSHT
jgi:hypothetical protein